MLRRLVVGAVVAAVVAGPLSAQLAITHANVVDVTTGTITRNATIVVQGRVIASITPNGAVPAGAEVIDAAGRFVTPGLIDAHTHISTLANARRALESGVTTVRSASVPHYEDVALRELVKAGVLAGPDVLAAGVFITPELGETILADPRLGAYYTSGVRTPDALRGVVRVNLDHHVDVIKTRGTERAGLPNTDPRKQVYTEAELRAIVDEARAGGVPVMVHAHGDEGAYAAVAAGAKSVEHGTFLSDSTLRLMKAKGAYLVPTLSTLYDLGLPGGDYDDPVLTLRAQFMIPRANQVIKAAKAMGIPIATGVDTDYRHESLSRVSHEVLRFTELGFTPLEALQSATTVAADLLGISARTGRVAPGLEADLLVVEGNPLEDPRALQDALVVVSNGKVAVKRMPFGKQ
ncbi:MAG: amidohydrolase family protein [Gemmatimonadetes bacterium]|nr:amidohydrolase family protein [Gemmatimonadota bacterium]